MKSEPTKPCLSIDCDGDSRVRGLCNNCYHALHSMILRGETTWAELEEVGMANQATAKVRSAILRAELQRRRK